MEVHSTTWTVGFAVFAVCESLVAAVREYAKGATE